jgi:Mg2+ and Co2+ transporter CorA
MRGINRSILRIPVLALIFASLCLIHACKSSGRTGDILGTSDQTAQAAQLVAEANVELKKIKVLYEKNENKRNEIKKALEANNAADVKKISDDVVYIINDGFDSGKAAVDKIAQAQEMEINDDYREYLRLKEDALRKQMEAFEHYRQAARALRDNYDPNNTAQREKVKEEFKTRSENYAKTMERARDYSNQANEVAKEVMQRQRESN